MMSTIPAVRASSCIIDWTHNDVIASTGPDYALCCKLDFGLPYFSGHGKTQCGEFGQAVSYSFLGGLLFDLDRLLKRH